MKGERRRGKEEEQRGSMWKKVTEGDEKRS